MTMIEGKALKNIKFSPKRLLSGKIIGEKQQSSIIVYNMELMGLEFNLVISGCIFLYMVINLYILIYTKICTLFQTIVMFWRSF